MMKELLKGTSTSGSEGRVARPANTFWTVEGSCDGVAGALDGVDRLTGTLPNSYDSSKWVHAASGSAHSWIVLKSPNSLGPIYMCIDANSATTTTYGIVFSKQAFISAIAPGAPAGTMTGSRPITNMAWAAGVNADPLLTSNVAVVTDQSPGSFYRAHISVDSSGSFNYMMSRDGSGMFSTLISLFNTVERTDFDNLFTAFTMFHSTTSGRGAPAWSSVGVSVSNCNGRTVDGVAHHSAGGFSSWTFGASGYGGVATPDQGYAFNRTLPIFIQTMVANRNCWRGRVPDLFVLGNVNVGESYPTRSNPTQHVVGDIVVPMSVIPII